MQIAGAIIGKGGQHINKLRHEVCFCRLFCPFCSCPISPLCVFIFILVLVLSVTRIKRCRVSFFLIWFDSVQSQIRLSQEEKKKTNQSQIKIRFVFLWRFSFVALLTFKWTIGYRFCFWNSNLFQFLSNYDSIVFDWFYVCLFYNLMEIQLNFSVLLFYF